MMLKISVFTLLAVSAFFFMEAIKLRALNKKMTEYNKQLKEEIERKKNLRLKTVRTLVMAEPFGEN